MLACPMQIIDCAQCKQPVKRKDMAHHQKQECPETMIECEYTRYGCDKMIKRKDQNKHNQEAMSMHLEAMKRSHDTLRRKSTQCMNCQHPLSRLASSSSIKCRICDHLRSATLMLICP